MIHTVLQWAMSVYIIMNKRNKEMFHISLDDVKGLKNVCKIIVVRVYYEIAKRNCNVHNSILNNYSSHYNCLDQKNL